MHPMEIILKLEQEPKTNKKIEILKAHKDNEDLRQFFYMALEPSIVFGIKKIPKVEQSIVLFSFPEAMMELYKFSSRELTGNAAIDHLQHLLQNSKPEDRELLTRIIKKDPNCKVAAKMVNKVWPDLVTITPYMRCSSAVEKNYNRIKFPALVQEKADGLFINAVNDRGNIFFLSRNGKPIDLLGHLEDDIKALSPNQKNYVVMGEGLVMSKDGVHFEDRKTGNGIVNKAIKGTITDDEASRVHLVVWDIVPLSSWKEGECIYGYEIRYGKLEGMVETAQDEGFDKISLIDTVEIENMEQAEAFFEAKLNEKKEGAIIKNMDGKWKNHTSPDAVKMKKKDPADLIVVDTIPHKKNPVWIGALVCESSDGKIKVSVGSGFSEADRENFPDHYVGKIIEVEYNEIIEDKRTGQKSLFLPIFKGIREDKDEADSYALILERSKGKSEI